MKKISNKDLKEDIGVEVHLVVDNPGDLDQVDFKNSYFIVYMLGLSC